MAKKNWMRNPARHVRNPLDTGLQVADVRVVVNGAALREIMKSEGAQAAVNRVAQSICNSANMTAVKDGAEYVVHPRVLRVSAHAFVDPANTAAVLDEAQNLTLEKAFWSH